MKPQVKIAMDLARGAVVRPYTWSYLAVLVRYRLMNKGGLQNDIETLVRLLPRPVLNGQLIAKSRNSWLIVEEYDQKEGIVVLNKITNHEGRVPYDSIREFRKPDMLILRAQVNLAKDGLFEISPFLDGRETEMITEEEEILPERMTHAETALDRCTAEEIEVLKEILIKETMEQGEIVACCTRHGIKNGDQFSATVSSRTSFLDVGVRQKVWIKPVFVPILEKLLLRPKPETDKRDDLRNRGT